MLDNFELLCVGGAAVVVTVLLLIVVERRNWRYVSHWMLLLTAGAWLWHVGLFAQDLLRDTTGDWAMTVRWLSRLVMTAGLLLMPSALLHGGLRLWRTGIEINPPRQPAYAGSYWPMFVLIPCAFSLQTDDPSAEFLSLVEPYTLPYLAGLTAINAFTATQFFRMRQTVTQIAVRRFFAVMGVTLPALTGLIVFAVAIVIPTGIESARLWRLAVSLTPVVPAILFGYFVGRFRLLPLILERTVVYSGIVVGFLLFHRLAVQGLTDKLSARFGVDLAIIQGGLIIALILAYRPLRQRTAEALRYLLGGRVHETREQARQLAVQMSEHANWPSAELFGWFVPSVRDVFRMETLSGWLWSSEPAACVCQAGDVSQLTTEHAHALQSRLVACGLTVCSRLDAPDDEVHAWLDQSTTEIAIRFERGGQSGLLLCGSQAWHQPLGEEQVSSLLLLVEQLGSTLHNSQLQAERLTAERLALQNEKLSTLGLLAGSMAHEIKNPLSSIKTIVTVMSEQLGPASPHAEDLRLVLGEVDRLCTTTSQLLDFVRPPREVAGPVDVTTVIEQTLRLLRLLARQRNVRLEARLANDLPAVTVGETSLREIVINLLANSIDAAGSGGCVIVSTRGEANGIVLEIHDSGPGIPPEIQNHIFEPFFTTKETGTGLGLYVVGRRVQELGGEIHCRSVPGEGTTFVLKLPLAPGGGEGAGG
jgi:signal transduction histidine kinase